MNKKYIAGLTDEERAVCETTVKNEKGKSEKLRRAAILLKADVDGPGWNDEKINGAHEVAPLRDARYAKTPRITLVCDSLNTHPKGAFYEAFPPEAARQ